MAARYRPKPTYLQPKEAEEHAKRVVRQDRPSAEGPRLVRVPADRARVYLRIVVRKSSDSVTADQARSVSQHLEAALRESRVVSFVGSADTPQRNFTMLVGRCLRGIARRHHKALIEELARDLLKVRATRGGGIFLFGETLHPPYFYRDVEGDLFLAAGHVAFVITMWEGPSGWSAVELAARAARKAVADEGGPASLLDDFHNHTELSQWIDEPLQQQS